MNENGISGMRSGKGKILFIFMTTVREYCKTPNKTILKEED